MPVSVVVGGQYGSEGKGKLVSHLACHSPAPVAVVRSGGSNAGHTADGRGRRFLLRQLPSGAVSPDCELFIAAGMLIDLDVLLHEVELTGIDPARLHIDPNATIISRDDMDAERSAHLGGRIGSTLSGTGRAAARKVMRGEDVTVAADVPELAPYLSDVLEGINDHIDGGGHLIVEGTQGFGLSLHHGPFPFVTSRDTTAGSFLADCGVGPARDIEVLVVLRTYPIRVAGNSGPLENELSWEDVQRGAGYPTALAEYTTVTGRLRRVAEFDWALAARAVRANAATALALHGVDYLDYADLGARSWQQLSTTTRQFVDELEQATGCYVRYVYTGPDGCDLIDREQGAPRTRRKRGSASHGSR